MVECKKFNIEKISKDYKKYWKRFGDFSQKYLIQTKTERPINDLEIDQNILDNTFILKTFVNLLVFKLS